MNIKIYFLPFKKYFTTLRKYQFSLMYSNDFYIYFLKTTLLIHQIFYLNSYVEFLNIITACIENKIHIAKQDIVIELLL